MKFLRPLLHFIFQLGYFGPRVMGTLDSSFLILPFGNDLVVVGLVAAHPHRVVGYVAMAALGSTIGQAMRQVAQSGVIASAVGIVCGLILAAGALRAIRSALFGVDVYDAATLTAIVGTLLCVTLLAATLPTLKIATIDPATTLREE